MASANIVGYQNKVLAENFNFVVNTFKAVGKDKDAMTLGDITPTEGVTYGGTIIQILDDGGATKIIEDAELGEVDAMFYWVDENNAKLMGCVPGWYLSADSECQYCQNDYVLPMGQGYMVENYDGEISLTYAGEVYDKGLDVPLADNFNFTGNASPDKVTFGDLIPGEVTSYGGTIIQLLDDGGATMVIEDAELGEVDAMFYWVDENNAKLMGCVPGWYLSADSECQYCQNSREVPAGSGFMVENYDGENTLTIPSAIPAAE